MFTNSYIVDPGAEYSSPRAFTKSHGRATKHLAIVKVEPCDIDHRLLTHKFYDTVVFTIDRLNADKPTLNPCRGVWPKRLNALSKKESHRQGPPWRIDVLATGVSTGKRVFCRFGKQIA